MIDKTGESWHIKELVIESDPTHNIQEKGYIFRRTRSVQWYFTSVRGGGWFWKDLHMKNGQQWYVSPWQQWQHRSTQGSPHPLAQEALLCLATAFPCTSPDLRFLLSHLWPHSRFLFAKPHFLSNNLAFPPCSPCPVSTQLLCFAFFFSKCSLLRSRLLHRSLPLPPPFLPYLSMLLVLLFLRAADACEVVLTLKHKHKQFTQTFHSAPAGESCGYLLCHRVSPWCP